MADDLLTDSLAFEGSETLKALGTDGTKVRVGAYAIRFAGPDEKDLTGEYFTKNTDFGPSCGNGAVTLFNHGIPLESGIKALADVADMTFPSVKTTRDDVGIFVESTLDTSDRYEKAIADLCAKGKLKWSTGTAPRLMRKDPDGEVKRWHIIEVSYTPKPAEFRLPAISPIKSLPAGAADAELLAAFVDKTESATAQSASAPTTTVKTMAAAALSPEELEKSQREAISTATKERIIEINEIKSMGERFKCAEAADSFIAEGKSVNDFRKHVVEDVLKTKPVILEPRVGMAKKDVKVWSFLKAVREIAHNGCNHNALSGVEKEASDATCKSIGRQPKGFFIPHDVAAMGLDEANDLGTNAIKALIAQAGQYKNLNAAQFASGSALVGTNLLTGSMIELLRNKPLVSQMGARTMTGLVGNVAIPRLNQGATTYWVSEQGTITESDQAFGQLGLTPKKLAARTGYTKELLNQSDLSVEAIVRDDLTTVLGIAKDLAAISGPGGAQPLGIVNQPAGLGSVTFGATATRAKAIAFQTALGSANALRGTLAYLTSPAVGGAWMGIAEAPNYPKWLWEGTVLQGTVVGTPAYSTNQIAGNIVIYGNWQDLILADWAGLDVVVNPYTGDATGVVTITIFVMTDVGVRQVVSFAVSTDAGNQ